MSLIHFLKPVNVMHTCTFIKKYRFKHKFKEQSHSVCLSQVLILIF